MVSGIPARYLIIFRALKERFALAQQNDCDVEYGYAENEHWRNVTQQF